jgi:predicted nucleic acid-binding protein
MALSFRRRVKVYLDTCCINRLFDDQTQERVRLEAEAVLAVLEKVERGEWSMVGSEVIDSEVDANPDLEKRAKAQKVLALAGSHVLLDDGAVARAAEFERFGLSAWDALHAACAERARAGVFLTVDADLLKRAERHATLINVPIRHPMEWLPEVMT